jgi:sulfite dehydrogenase
MTSRRIFLKQISLATLASTAAPAIFTWALPQQQSIDVPGEDGMILRSFRFVDLETPVEYFNTWLTPVPHFFVRNHMHEPSELDPTDWRLSLGGEVEKPFTLSLAELSKLETHSVVNTLE